MSEPHCTYDCRETKPELAQVIYSINILALVLIHTIEEEKKLIMWRFF